MIILIFVKLISEIQLLAFEHHITSILYFLKNSEISLNGLLLVPGQTFILKKSFCVRGIFIMETITLIKWHLTLECPLGHSYTKFNFWQMTILTGSYNKYICVVVLLIIKHLCISTFLLSRQYLIIVQWCQFAWKCPCQTAHSSTISVYYGVPIVSSKNMIWSVCQCCTLCNVMSHHKS